MTVPVHIVGMVGGEVFGRRAAHALRTADVLVASARHLAHVATNRPTEPSQVIELTGVLDRVVDRIVEARDAGRSVCVIASGDPGFFGIVRVLARRLGRGALRVHPAPSSVSLAWARAAMSWDDADVVSAHGRPLAEAVDHMLRRAKVAVLTAPGSPPERVGAELLAAGCGPRAVTVVSRIGEPDETVVATDLTGLATGHFDPMSVVLLVAPSSTPDDGSGAVDAPTVSWGAPASAFVHRDGMITKGEVRAVALAKLALPRRGVLWDIGAGSGSVGIEAATIAPELRVWAVERAPDDAARIAANAAAFGVADRVEVVVDTAPSAFAELPDPDRVFVGGGGLDVVTAAWERLAPGGILVATFVVLDRAVAALGILGEMVQLHVDRAVPIGSVGVRLEPTNPTFVCWGRR